MDEAETAAWEMFDQAVNELDADSESMRKVLKTAEPLVVRLKDGDWHVCQLCNCPHAYIDADHQYVCALSGLSWGAEFVGEHDPTWTGRSTTSGDPDAISGIPPGGWRPRRDAYAESQRAFEAAHSLDDSEVIYVETQKELDARKARENVRRGALCVDQVEDPNQPQKKQRTSKKQLTRDCYEKLTAEVRVVMDRLTSTKKTESTPAADTETASTEDPRLQNPEFVVNVAIRKWMKRCAEGADRFDRDKIHNIVVYAHAIARQKRAEAQERQEANKNGKRKRIFGGEMKQHVAALVLALWRAACSTEFLREDAKRGADSFRPFCSGILYALKRGVRMGDGLEIVPVITSLADQLPTLRSVDASDAARQLQSASHRGLCTLHRSISSFETAEPHEEGYCEAKQAFEDAAVVAAQLARFCKG